MVNSVVMYEAQLKQNSLSVQQISMTNLNLLWNLHVEIFMQNIRRCQFLLKDLILTANISWTTENVTTPLDSCSLGFIKLMSLSFESEKVNSLGFSHQVCGAV